ncbi:hypothetical protein [Phycicoccus sp. Soil748]|uniref:hypothetical protein n=1 Tax=Phycicoccus sp. Soil748 TaxID=1736397 RepID=UPI000702F3EE|nr:hypothetical protein [Phycicoccus sp. Soil748]KRE56423.1 hypothetical protein ASG70_04715 [Phycicoccus sp. Soil748]
MSDHETEDTGHATTPGDPGAGATVATPALLIRRARDVHESLVGKRARFLMTSHTPGGDWLAHGWKDGLRIVSEPSDGIAGLDETGVWLQEEREYYRDCDTTNRFAVGLSRVWVEQHVSAPAPTPEEAQNAWLDNLNRDPNTPEVRHLQPAEGYPDPVGRRVIVTSDGVEADMRAVSPVRMTNGGELAITVLDECDWYGWAHDYPAAPHPTLRWELASRVWVE